LNPDLKILNLKNLTPV